MPFRKRSWLPSDWLERHWNAFGTPFPSSVARQDGHQAQAHTRWGQTGGSPSISWPTEQVVWQLEEMHGDEHGTG